MINIHCTLNSTKFKKVHNISVLKLSNEIGHRRTTIMELVHNTNMDKKKISAELIMKLCLYFEVSPNDLFEIRLKK